MRRIGSVESANKNSYFEDELRMLLTRKNQLESRIDQLQQSREELTLQLDHLGRVLQQRSTTSSPYGRLNISPSPMNSKNISFRSYSTPTTPIHHRFIKHGIMNHFYFRTSSLF
jgi:hypothetical protein